jgi:hypothetical protein
VGKVSGRQGRTQRQGLDPGQHTANLPLNGARRFVSLALKKPKTSITRQYTTLWQAAQGPRPAKSELLQNCPNPQSGVQSSRWLGSAPQQAAAGHCVNPSRRANNPNTVSAAGTRHRVSKEMGIEIWCISVLSEWLAG